jgi:hypothetical protein
VSKYKKAKNSQLTYQTDLFPTVTGKIGFILLSSTNFKVLDCPDLPCFIRVKNNLIVRQFPCQIKNIEIDCDFKQKFLNFMHVASMLEMIGSYPFEMNVLISFYLFVLYLLKLI